MGEDPASDEEPRLDVVLDGIWRLLNEGLRSRQHGFHCAGVASVRPDGSPSVRTMVLRGVDVARRRLYFHTDVRSRKLGEVPVEPRVSILFYDPPEHTQLRVEAVASVHRGDRLADEHWQAIAPLARRCYLSAGPPGLPWGFATSGLPPEVEERAPTLEESERGRLNFAVLQCEVRRFDWLYLSSIGNRRAGFRWEEGGRLRANWLIP